MLRIPHVILDNVCVFVLCVHITQLKGVIKVHISVHMINSADLFIHLSNIIYIHCTHHTFNYI